MGGPTALSPIMTIYTFIEKSLASRRNCYVWTGVSSRMLVVESDEAITVRLCLFCKQHGEGEGKEKITCKSMQKPMKPLAKLRYSSVVICAQGLAPPAGARLQRFLAEDLPNSRMDFVFCSCNPPCSGRRMFNHVIFAGVLTDLFLRRSRATNANVPLSTDARKYSYIFFYSP
jgi:hypothetical protein